MRMHCWLLWNINLILVSTSEASSFRGGKYSRLYSPATMTSSWSAVMQIIPCCKQPPRNLCGFSEWKQPSVMTMSFLLDPGRYSTAAHFLMRPVAKRSQEFMGSVVYRISVISSLLEWGLNKQTKKHPACSPCACNSKKTKKKAI